MSYNQSQNTNVNKTNLHVSSNKFYAFSMRHHYSDNLECQWVLQVVDMVKSVLEMDSQLEEGVVGLYLDVIMKVKLYCAYLFS